MPNRIFEGIDLANAQDNLGQFFMSDNGKSLIPVIGKPEQSSTKIAIDSPFGTSLGYYQLLKGQLPSGHSEDNHKSRATEVWLRRHVAEYSSVQRWTNRTNAERRLFPRVAYFSPSGHVQSTLRLCIVPECLEYLAEKFQTESNSDDYKTPFRNARRGLERWVEAHPRMFLYSIVERIFLDQTCTLEVLNSVAKYKVDSEHRAEVLDLITKHQDWMGVNKRRLQFSEIKDELIENDHYFDAMLSALTAWAFDNGECIDWKSAKIPSKLVDVEGHILVLRT